MTILAQRFYTHFVFFWLFFFPILILAVQPIEVKVGQDPLYIGSKVQYLADPSFGMDLETIQSAEASARFKDCEDDFLKFGMQSQAIWIRFQLQRDSGLNKPLYLNLRSTRLDSIVFFHPTDDGSFDRFSGGITVPFDERSVKRREPVFELTPLEGDSVWYYIRVASPLGQNFMPFLQSKDQMDQAENRFLLGLAIGVGLLFAAMMIGILQFFIFRKEISLYFTLMTFVNIVVLLFFYGLIQQIFATQTAFSISFVFSISFPILKISEILFFRSFFKTKENYPWLDRGLLGIGAFLIPYLIIAFSSPPEFVVLILFPINLLMDGVVIFLAFKGVKNQKLPNLFFRLGIGIYYLINFFAVLMTLGVLPSGVLFYPDNLFPLPATVLRILLFTLGVYFVVENMRKGKLAADELLKSYESEMESLRDRILVLMKEQDDLASVEKASPSKEPDRLEQDSDIEPGTTSISNRIQKLNEQLLSPLTPRELEMLEAISLGLPNKQIAERFFVSVNTVKTHIARIYGKLDVSNRTEAAGRVLGQN